jgi:hypothetical protein
MEFVHIPVPFCFSVSVHREVVQVLAFSTMCFTEPLKHIVERMIEDASSERDLRGIAAFLTFNGVTDTDVYELRDSVFDEVGSCLLPLHTQKLLRGQGRPPRSPPQARRATRRSALRVSSVQLPR